MDNKNILKFVDKKVIRDTGIDFILENTYDGYWDWKIKENYEYMSPRFWEMFGYKPEEKTHNPIEWQKIIHPDDAERALKLYEEHAKSKGKIPYELYVRYYHKNGSIVNIFCRGKIIEWDSDGEPIRIVGVHTDVTKFKKQTIELERYRTELEISKKTLESRTSLINYIFHEIRNPINVINVGLETILENNLDKETYEILNLMKRSIDRATKILNDTLDYSKFETKLNNLVAKPINFSSMIEESVKLRKLNAKKYNISIFTNIDSNVIVNIDKSRMFQVINNLLSNAIKFTYENGQIFVTLVKNNGCAEFSIKDTGCGIDEKNLNKIFVPYNDIKSYTNSLKKGMGLGLSITKKIVELHDSYIEVESEVDKGTTFKFNLKLTENSIEEKDIENVKEEKEEKDVNEKVEKIRILVVDDDRDNKIILKKLLRIKGFEAESLEDGKEFVEYVKNNIKDGCINYDLVLLDNLMKHMDGKDALEICRKEDKFIGKVAMLTGSTTEESKKLFLEAGANWVLEKPLDFSILMDIVNKL